jgi:hypothetical protein
MVGLFIVNNFPGNSILFGNRRRLAALLPIATKEETHAGQFG